MNRDDQIMLYLSNSEKRTIHAKAQAADLSMSEWVREATEEKIEREGMESATERYRIEERILDLLDESADRAAEKIVEELRKNDDLDRKDNPYADWGE